MPWTLAFTLVVFIPLAGVNYYVGRTIYRALTSVTAWDKRLLRSVIALLLIYVNLLPVVFLLAYLIWGRTAVPIFAGDIAAVDLLLTYPFWIALVVMVQLFLLFGLLDLITFFVNHLIPPFGVIWSQKVPLITLVLLFATGIYSVITITRDTWGIRVVEREVALPPAFKSLGGFRIAQISDVQGDGRTSPARLRRFVAKVNAQRPDLVLFAGDLVTSGTRYIDTTAAILGGLKARLGLIAALGDHDYFSRKAMVVQALLREGIGVAEDTTLLVGTASDQLAITVMTYTYPQRPSKEKLSKLLQEPEQGYRILLVHQPAEALVESASRSGYQLLLAGHTHGGGIAFGIPGLFLVAPATFESEYFSGMYKVGGLVVSVTNGLGFTLAPIRYHAPAEIVMITLR
jgi:predicted MPP superfamily phosphohydrolase